MLVSAVTMNVILTPMDWYVVGVATVHVLMVNLCVYVITLHLQDYHILENDVNVLMITVLILMEVQEQYVVDEVLVTHVNLKGELVDVMKVLLVCTVSSRQEV